MSKGYAFLLSNGAISPLHKQRDMLDQPNYRAIWDNHSGHKVVAIVRCRKKPKPPARSHWFELVKDVPADGRWHPYEIQPGRWQAVLAHRHGVACSYHYDWVEVRNDVGNRERASMIHHTRESCEQRCDVLNLLSIGESRPVRGR